MRENIWLIEQFYELKSFLKEREDAFEFLAEKRDFERALRSLVYTGKEQRREAKENYEEKCARSFIKSALNKKRWCPPLTS